MRIGSNRMQPPVTRNAPPVPVERVLVQPPPESVLKCPRCGAARINGMTIPGGHPRQEGHRRICKGCGTKLLYALDFRSVRIVG